MKLFKKIKIWALKKDNDGEIAIEIIKKIGKKKAYLVAIFCVIFAWVISGGIFSILPDIYIFDNAPYPSTTAVIRFVLCFQGNIYPPQYSSFLACIFSFNHHSTPPYLLNQSSIVDIIDKVKFFAVILKKKN